MKEFGVQESWTRLFRIDYFNFAMNDFRFSSGQLLLPLYLSTNEIL